MPDKTENLAKIKGKREQRRHNFWQQAFQPTVFKKKSRNYFRLPGYKRENRNNVVKNLKSRKVKASILIGILLFSMVSGIFFTLMAFNIDIVFNINNIFNNISGCYVGPDSKFNQVVTNNISNNGNFGIYVGNSDDNIVRNNYINNNTQGIRVYSNSDRNNFSGNVIKNSIEKEFLIYKTLLV